MESRKQGTSKDNQITMTRTFASGAIRDTSKGKISYLARNPIVEASFAKYMTEHSFMPDGTRRSMQNWFKGFGLQEDMESLVRHVADLEAMHAGYLVYKARYKDGREETMIESTDWLDHEASKAEDMVSLKRATIEDTINAIRFNCGVYLLDLFNLTPSI